MATALSRHANQFRKANRFLHSHFLHNYRSFVLPSSPPPPPPSEFHNQNLTFLRSVIPVSVGVQSLPVHQRFFCSGSPVTSSATSTKSEQTNSTKSEQTKSDENDNSGGDSQQGGGDAGKSVRGGPVSWLSFLLLMVTGAGILLYYDKEKKQHIEDINKASEAVKEGPAVGKAAIGGPFNLINHEGKNVTEKDFLGKWTLIYFGFTHCPDICPDELVKLAAALDKIKEKAGFEIVPLFISVDPERDTVEQVREYVKEFHPKLVGLTGSPEEIKKTARAYRVYYMKTAEEDSDYLVDHSIVMYLMGPNMDFVKFFGKNNDVDSLTEGIIKEIKQYKSKK